MYHNTHSENEDHGIQSHHFMENIWGNSGNSGFTFGVSKITADGDFSHEIKRHLLLGRKVMTNLDSILSRAVTLPTKVRLVKALAFPVVMHGCESWTIKQAECQRIDAFELWFWGRLLRVPWTARTSNQSILKEISPGCSLEVQFSSVQSLSHVRLLVTQWIAARQASLFITNRNDAKAETPVLWPPHAKSWLIGKDSDAGRDCGQEEKGMTEDEMAGWHHWLDGCESEWTPGVGDG